MGHKIGPGQSVTNTPWTAVGMSATPVASVLDIYSPAVTSALDIVTLEATYTDVLTSCPDESTTPPTVSEPTAFRSVGAPSPPANHLSVTTIAITEASAPSSSATQTLRSSLSSTNDLGVSTNSSTDSLATYAAASLTVNLPTLSSVGLVSSPILVTTTSSGSGSFPFCLVYRRAAREHVKQ